MSGTARNPARQMAGLLAAATIFTCVSVPASASGTQTEHGRVLVPTGPQRVGGAYVSECRGVVSGLVIWTTGTEPFAHRFRVDPATRGHQFSVTPELPADLDLVFEVGGDRRKVIFEERGLQPERGTVPTDARDAYVCLATGAPTDFTYRAGA